MSWVGLIQFPLVSPLGFSFTGFGFCIKKFINPCFGKWQFPNLCRSTCCVAVFVSISHFTCPERCHLFQEICFLGSAVTRSCLISKLRFLLYSCDFKFVLYSCHVHADHFNYMVPRSLGSQSFCYSPSASLVSLSSFFATSFGNLRTLTYGWGSFCVVSALMFALLRAFDLIGAWSQTQKCHLASIQPSTKSAVLSRRVALVVL